MKFYHSQKKKVRGWKRRVHHLDRWGELIKEPHTKYFLTERGRHTYERYTVSPFYNLVKRHPPLWFYKLIIAKLVTAYSEWQKTFDKLNVPYDLQLWLYDPSYIRSEIICHKMQQHGERKRFSWESDLSKPFPYEKLGSKHYNLQDFEWILADDEHIHFEDDFEDANFTAEDLLADGYIRKQQSDGLIYYAKRYGDIWIGRRRDAMSKDTKDVIQGYFAPPRTD
ncbi:hypothetical protein [uncultured Mucilaginibacter sp.]|uniref:hypothetical protein n=1 Tax=uncultured Mucilaginibacter sp. TaxID=797541 RepID=UPI0025D31DAD|nr:hypothetical protein [uncultured Mucilaginibacter sp.]